MLLAMFAGKYAGLDSVMLSWYGEAGPYDVERATLPDFSDAVRLGAETFGTQTIDPVPSDGAIYLYRVRWL